MSKRRGYKTQRAVWSAITRELAAYGLPPAEPHALIGTPMHPRDKRAAARDAEKERLRELVREALKKER